MEIGVDSQQMVGVKMCYDDHMLIIIIVMSYQQENHNRIPWYNSIGHCCECNQFYHCYAYWNGMIEGFKG